MLRLKSWGDRTSDISVKRIHAPGGMIEYVAITASYAWELTSVSVCYSQGDGFNTSLSRLGHYFRRLNSRLKAQSGELGNLLTIYDEMDQSTYFSCLNLASEFLQLTIHDVDRYFTVFRDAERKLWENVRCDFDLKTTPSAFVKYVGGSSMIVKKKGVCNRLGDIIIRTCRFEEQLELLRYDQASYR